MKDSYKELRRKLRNEFVKPRGDYGVPSSVGVWLYQCAIKPDKYNLSIICKIKGSVPYPHQEVDRLEIITYLKNNKYKQFKKDYK